MLSALPSVETAPQPSEVSPSQRRHLAESSCLHPAAVPFTSAHQSTIIPAVSPSGPHTSALDSPPKTQSQDLLLPPSAFMTSATQNTVIISYSYFDGYQDARCKLRLRLYSIFFQVGEGQQLSSCRFSNCIWTLF